MVTIAGRRLYLGKLAIYVDGRDGWVGVFDDGADLFICPVPFVVFRWPGGPFPVVLVLLALVMPLSLAVFFLVPSGAWDNALAALDAYLVTFELLVAVTAWRRARQWARS